MATFAELRHALRFGPRRLRWLLWLQGCPQIEEGSWAVIATMGAGHSVKIRLIEGGLQMEEVSPPEARALSS